ncbi:MAG: ATP-binding cassette domain-containing protein, partial [Desulfotignum sp.]
MTELSIKKLIKTYHGKTVVDKADLTVKQGRVTGLLGPNGAGKTTTFYMTVGMIRPDSGHVFLGDEDITRYPMFIRARKGLGYLPQESSIFKKLTVRENITAILEVLPQKGGNIQTKASDLMQELGIQDLARQKAVSLSGGERRRLEISRVL